MATLTAVDPLVEKLMRTEGKAEIIDGKVVNLPVTGDEPAYAALEITVELRLYVRQNGVGRAVQDGSAFLCDLPNRRAFSPDAAYYTGTRGGMKFFPEPPVFAVEVRSEHDYGRNAERAIIAKIEDYFAAGTLVVWDVDLRNEDVVAKFTAPDANNPQVFRRGDVADAGEAVPGWTFEVDALFEFNLSGN